MRRILILLSYGLTLAVGFAGGVFTLPLLTAPPAPTPDVVMRDSEQARWSGSFRRDLADSDWLHWGEGDVYIHPDRVAFRGALAPGPDYRLYFSPEFLETEAEFLDRKNAMVEAGPVRTFDNFLVPLPEGLDPEDYRAVIVWCEAFGQFITAARYR